MEEIIAVGVFVRKAEHQRATDNLGVSFLGGRGRRRR
jgi:hypothetical protein